MAKHWKESVKDAIWRLTDSASCLQGLSGYSEIQKKILDAREELAKKFAKDTSKVKT